MSVLSKEDIRALVQRRPPLAEGYLDLEQQLQPCGLDLTLREVALFQTPGQLGVKDRQVSYLAPLTFDAFGHIDLAAGAYLVTCNEIVNLPNDVMGLARPRSTLLRCGACVHTAVWDPGYSGRSQSLLVVYNSGGLRLERNARIVQVIFLRLSTETEEYQGVYQGENVTR